MKLKKNIYRKICDMGGCVNTAEYCICQSGVCGTDICRCCMIKLYREIKRVFHDKKE